MIEQYEIYEATLLMRRGAGFCAVKPHVERFDNTRMRFRAAWPLDQDDLREGYKMGEWAMIPQGSDIEVMWISSADLTDMVLIDSGY